MLQQWEKNHKYRAGVKLASYPPPLSFSLRHVLYLDIIWSLVMRDLQTCDSYRDGLTGRPVRAQITAQRACDNLTFYWYLKKKDSFSSSAGASEVNYRAALLELLQIQFVAQGHNNSATKSVFQRCQMYVFVYPRSHSNRILSVFNKTHSIDWTRSWKGDVGGHNRYASETQIALHEKYLFLLFILTDINSFNCNVIIWWTFTTFF